MSYAGPEERGLHRTEEYFSGQGNRKRNQGKKCSRTKENMFQDPGKRSQEYEDMTRTSETYPGTENMSGLCPRTKERDLRNM
jgi:hypothetical protein